MRARPKDGRDGGAEDLGAGRPVSTGSGFPKRASSVLGNEPFDLKVDQGRFFVSGVRTVGSDTNERFTEGGGVADLGGMRRSPLNLILHPASRARRRQRTRRVAGY
jgi:hypothetical protein